MKAQEEEAQTADVLVEAIGKPTLGVDAILKGVWVASLIFLVIGLVAPWKRCSSNEAMIKDEVTALTGHISAQREQLNRERVAMGLSPLPVGAESLEEVALRLKKDSDHLVSMSSGISRLLMSKETEASASQAEVGQLKVTLQKAEMEAQRLRGQLEQASAAVEEAAGLRAELKVQQQSREALLKEISGLREEALAAKSSGGTVEEFAALQRRLDEAGRAREFFENRVKASEASLVQNKVFANSEAEMQPQAVKLFRGLRNLESASGAGLGNAYVGFASELGAQVRHTLPFPVGSSVLSDGDKQRIQKIGEEVQDGDLVLVVGYSSVTGNPEGNRVLASQRATAVAEWFSTFKRAGQNVQAAYVGQTTRFSQSEPDRNQVVEIWHIRKGQ